MPNFEYDRANGSFKAWLLRITRWRITDQMRKRGPLTLEPFNPNVVPDTVTLSANSATENEVLAMPCGPGAEAMWNETWQENLLAAAVKKVKRELDPQKYQLFDFYVNKNWPAEKVAATFGLPVEQVYLAKHRVTESIAAEVRRLENLPASQ